MPYVITSEVQALMPALEKLNSDQLNEVVQLIRGNDWNHPYGRGGLHEKKYQEEAPLREAKWKKQAEENTRRKEREAEARPKKIKFLKNFLQIGDIVKFSGTRDRGFRQIQEINQHSESNIRILGRQIFLKWNRKLSNEYELFLGKQFTENAIDKITHVRHPRKALSGEGRKGWVKVSDLMKKN